MKTALTGASGFLGSYILQALPDEVVTIGRNKNNTIRWDLAEPVPTLGYFDRVIHAAGKAHSIPKNKKEKDEFFRVNLEGTKNLLRALSVHPPKQFVFISTVSVYGLDEGEMITEGEPLNGSTPYAKSKIQAEQAIKIWGARHNCKVLTLRLPLITGANPPGNLKSMIQAISGSYYFRIGEGNARKSMVGAPDVAQLIAYAAEAEGTYHLTDGIHPSISEVDLHFARLLGKSVKSISPAFLNIIAKFGDIIPGFPLNSNRLQKLNNTLTFDDNRARKELGWKPKPALSYLKI